MRTVNRRNTWFQQAGIFRKSDAQRSCTDQPEVGFVFLNGQIENPHRYFRFKCTFLRQTEIYMENLRIDNPCPMLLSRMEKEGDGYFCKSCSKHTVDFRGKTPEEIRSQLTANTCGIFYPEQLSQSPTPFFRQGLFYALTVLSFLGFNVSPLKAAPQVENPVHQTEISQAGTVAESNDRKDRKHRKHRRRARRNKSTHTMGAPRYL
jgi:hypothetical protein